MSFPDIRAALDAKAFELWKRQVVKTQTGEPVVQDSSSLVAAADDLVKGLDADVARTAWAKHVVEHSYKTARNRTKTAGKHVLERLFRGEWPLPVELDDSTYTAGNDHYPLRYLTFTSYSEIIDARLRQTKHEHDRMNGANEKRLTLLAIWGNRMLGEVAQEQMKPKETP